MKIAIASGKGGTGKTLVSTNLFYTLQQHGYRVKLIDCDAEEPNDLIFFKGILSKSFCVNQKVPVINEINCTYCGKCHEYCNYNAIFILPPSKVIKVIEDLCHGCGACSAACIYSAITEKDVSLGTVSCFGITEKTSIIEAKINVGIFSPVSVIKAAIKEAGNEGIIILDSPPGTSCPFIQTVATADYVILVTEPTPFGLSDLKQSVETLKTMGKTCGIIINRAGLGNNDIYSYLNQENIPILMEIPFDKTIASHYSKGEIVAKYMPEWQPQFMSMLNSIVEKDGNCSY
ncbi:cobyrinic acid a,c-diamide synthase [Tenuifilaceae bacterium CYCD]|nr:cobyrinic acid a,c-diamide synthase [Tenuifilaceae bacterium CYCD]